MNTYSRSICKYTEVDRSNIFCHFESHPFTSYKTRNSRYLTYLLQKAILLSKFDIAFRILKILISGKVIGPSSIFHFAQVTEELFNITKQKEENRVSFYSNITCLVPKNKDFEMEMLILYILHLVYKEEYERAYQILLNEQPKYELEGDWRIYYMLGALAQIIYLLREYKEGPEYHLLTRSQGEGQGDPPEQVIITYFEKELTYAPPQQKDKIFRNMFHFFIVAGDNVKLDKFLSFVPQYVNKGSDFEITLLLLKNHSLIHRSELKILEDSLESKLYPIETVDYLAKYYNKKINTYEGNQGKTGKRDNYLNKFIELIMNALEFNPYENILWKLLESIVQQHPTEITEYFRERKKEELWHRFIYGMKCFQRDYINVIQDLKDLHNNKKFKLECLCLQMLYTKVKCAHLLFKTGSPQTYSNLLQKVEEYLSNRVGNDSMY